MTKPAANVRLYALLGIALIALLAVLFFGDRLFGGAAPAQPAGYVSRAMLGDQWPLTVEDGTLACTGSGGSGAVTFTANGTMYALNGVARQQSTGADIAPIWAADGSGAKRDLGPLIEKGLALCR